MGRFLLPCLLWPCFLFAQPRQMPVEPVQSGAYAQMLSQQTTGKLSFPDSGVQVLNSTDRVWANYPVSRAKISKGSVRFITSRYKNYLLSGSFTSIFSLSIPGRQPELQNEFVQGRSQGGATVWGGPETGEIFSYGPALQTLEFNGQAYSGDNHGQLVPRGSGNGEKGIAYNNSVLRTGFGHQQSLNIGLKKNLYSGRDLQISLIAMREDQQMILVQNQNERNAFSGSVSKTFRNWTLTGEWIYGSSRFSNPSEDGFINRVWRESLLTPVSFQNSQGYWLGSAQRRFGVNNDNPLFLLQQNGRGSLYQQNNRILRLKYNFSGFQLTLDQSYENTCRNLQMGYQPGTAAFENGYLFERTEKGSQYTQHVSAQKKIQILRRINSQVQLNQNLSISRYQILISLPDFAYNRKRTTEDFSAGIYNTMRINQLETGLNLIHKLSASTGYKGVKAGLPQLSAYVIADKPRSSVRIKWTGTFSRSVQEIPLQTSFASSGMTLYKAGEADRFLPMEEPLFTKNIQPVIRTDRSTGLEISWKNRLSFSLNFYNNRKKHEVFCVQGNNGPELLNAASTKYYGSEWTASYSRFPSSADKLRWDFQLSATNANAKVLSVKDGYNNLPVAGFSNLYTALVKGYAPGVMMGTDWLRNNAGERIIGADGFPVADTKLKVLGNPNPDFILKGGTVVSWKSWNIQCWLSWNKGGERWNGTEAVLDYYGRSARSAQQRGITDYVFSGVDINGHPNTHAVSFYDPAQPVEASRFVRYGITGVAADYIQKADCIRLQYFSAGREFQLGKTIKKLRCALYASDILLWSPYRGGDPAQTLLGYANTNGLDYFNLPGFAKAGCSITIQL